MLCILWVTPFLCMNLVSAFEFDNQKTFNKDDRSIVVRNSFAGIFPLDEVAKVTPLDPHVNRVFGIGKDVLVYRFEIDSKEIYDEGAFDDMKFYDMNKNNQTINRKYTLKKLVDTVYEERIHHIENCSTGEYYENGTEKCYNNIERRGYRVRDVWEEIDTTKDLPKGKITLGIFADVKIGDKVEFVPTWFGIEMPEYAVWENTMSDDLLLFYKMDEASGTNVEDSHTLSLNSTAFGGVTVNSNGILNTGFNFDGNSGTALKTIEPLGNYLGQANKAFSVSLWFNASVVAGNDGLFDLSNVGGTGRYSGIQGSSQVKFQTTSSCINIANTDTTAWHHFVVTYNGSVVQGYFDGVNSQNCSFNTAIDFRNNNLSIGVYESAALVFDGNIDEFGLWNRTLNFSEVNDLYNGGAGLSYPVEADQGLEITLNTPSNNSNLTATNVTFNCSGTDETGVVNLTLIIDDIFNETITNSTAGENLSIERDLNLTEGLHNWTCEASDGTGAFDPERAGARWFQIDSISPTISITTPGENVLYQSISNNLTVNWTVSDANLETCWWTMDEGVSNNTVTCSDNTTVINITSISNNSVTFYANDSLGNENSTIQSWNYSVFKSEEGYAAKTSEGATETFLLNITTNGTQLSSVRLIYNNTEYSASFSNTAGNNYTLSKDLDIPALDSSVNNTFYWNITLEDSTVLQSDGINQSAINIGIDDCSTNGVIILNLSLKDEITQNELNGTLYNTTVEVDVDIFPEGSTTSIINFSGNYSENNNPQVCINDLNVTYRMDVEIFYDGDGYSGEFYNIQNSTLVNTSIPNNINLFDLEDGESQLFRIEYKDENFLPVKGALIEIQRKYVSDGLFKTVEIPKTDDEGRATASFQLTGASYTILVTKQGTVLATFDDVAVFCEDTLTGNCNINLNALSSGLGFPEWDELEGITYTMSFDPDARTVTTIFTSADGSTKTVLLNTTKFDRLGNTTVCSDTLTSASGTLTCTIPTSFGNTTVISQLISDGNIIVQNVYTIVPNVLDRFGRNGGVMFLVMVMTLPLMLITSNIAVIIGIFAAVILGSLFNLFTNNTMLGASSLVIYVIVAGGIIIWKIARRE